MSTHEHEPGGIHARRIEADNVVSGVQIQGGDAQTASSLIHLAQSIRRGDIRAEEIKARNLVSQSRLPAPLTPLVGREQEIAAVCALLSRPEVRLVTLTGTGGVGKTRLALGVAAAVNSDFADGICSVALAPLTDPGLVLPTIAQALGVREQAHQSLRDSLQDHLRDRQLLLVLDNFEQLVSAAPLVAELLVAAPRLHVLVTSRASLHLSGEHEFVVPPLALPDLRNLPPLNRLIQYGAIRLFVERAQAVQSDFAMTAENATAVAAICHQVDGLPLAIELAAGRSKLFSPQALLPRLRNRLKLLVGGAQDLPLRQQTLRKTIDWSYDLLEEDEKALFRRLAVFVGGCTLEAAEAVCNAHGDLEEDVLDAVAILVDKSLVRQEEQADGEPRLLMLETLREYGLEALTASGEVEAIRQAHTRYYLALAEKAEPELGGAQQTVWLERLEWEHDNLRAAMQWSVEQGKAGQSMEMALRLGGALQQFWIVRSLFYEGRTFLEKALAGSEGVVVPGRAKAVRAAASFAFAQGDNDRAETLGKESLAQCRELGDIRGAAASLHHLADVAWVSGNFALARSLAEESLTISKEVSDIWSIAYMLADLANLFLVQGEYDTARSHAEEALTLFRTMDEKWGIAYSLRRLGKVLFSQGDQAMARPLLEESLVLCRALGDKNNIAYSLYWLGCLALVQGAIPTASSLAEESLALSREVGDRIGIGQTLSLLGRLAAFRGDYVAAQALYAESLARASEGNYKTEIVYCQSLEGLADVVAAKGEPTRAAQIWGAAEVLRETMGAPLPPVWRTDYERSVAAARLLLGENAFSAAWTQGRTMPLEQVLAAQGPVTMPTTAPAEPPSVPHVRRASTSPHGLTAREVEVLRLLALGLTNPQIAEQLVISPQTVHAHLRSMYSKLGVTTRSAATRFAVEHHIV